MMSPLLDFLYFNFLILYVGPGLRPGQFLCIIMVFLNYDYFFAVMSIVLFYDIFPTFFYVL